MQLAVSTTTPRVDKPQVTLSQKAEMPGSCERGLLLHAPLVRSIAYALGRRGGRVEMDDLVSAGMIGLIEAADRYDADRGTSFATFAYRRIRGAIIDEIRRCATQTLSQRDAAAPLSWSAPVSEAPDLTLIDVTVDRHSPEPDMHAALGELLGAMRELPDRERDMLRLSVAGHTVAEIAELHGCSESRVSQMLLQARLRLEEWVAA